MINALNTVASGPGRGPSAHVKALLDAGADLEFQDEFGGSILHKAALNLLRLKSKGSVV